MAHAIIHHMKRPIGLSLIVLGAVFFISLSGCSSSSPSESTSQSNAGAAKTTGVSGTLPKLSGAPRWNLELVGTPVTDASIGNSFDLPKHGKVPIVGWAVDQDAKTGAGGVEIVIDGTPLAARYGLPRPDVASAYGIPAYTNVGYSLELTADEFTPGAHTAFVRVLSNDRKGYWEVGPYTLKF